MSESSLQKKGYMSSKDAGALLGYTHDYISRLCRHGKMSGIQKGREWFVTQEELNAFKLRHEIELKEKKIELSKKFSQIRRDAEAKKREAKKQLSSISTPVSKQSEPISYGHQKSLKFSVPKQLVALSLFGLLVMGQTIFNVVSNTKLSYQPSPTVSTFSFSDISNSIEEGIQETLYAQSTVVQPVAATFAFVPYLADGYYEFFMVVGELPKETYHSLRSIGEGYLVFYVMQGEALYESIGKLNTLGAGVLRGYELLGESFLFGSKDIVALYARLLHLESGLETSSRNVDIFSANVSGGFQYAKDNVQQNIFEYGFSELVFVINSIHKNISLNLLSMRSTLGAISSTMTAQVGSLFEFNLVKKDAQIRAIKLDK